MASANAGLIKFEPRRSLAFGSISSSYAGVGAAFANPVRQLKMVNNTDADLDISFDGVTDHDVILAGQSWIYDYCSNNSTVGSALEQQIGTRVYVKQTSSAPTVNSVYVVVIYADIA